MEKTSVKTGDLFDAIGVICRDYNDKIIKAKQMVRCEWCTEEITRTPVKGGDFGTKNFCSHSCRINDYEFHHDNCFSDAGSGL